MYTPNQSPSSEVHPSSREIRIPEERERGEERRGRSTPKTNEFQRNIQDTWKILSKDGLVSSSREGERENRTERAGTDIASRSLFWEQDLRPSSRSSWWLVLSARTQTRANLHARERVSPRVSSPFPSFSSSRIPICEWELYSSTREYPNYIIQTN